MIACNRELRVRLAQQATHSVVQRFWIAGDRGSQVDDGRSVQQGNCIVDGIADRNRAANHRSQLLLTGTAQRRNGEPG